MVACDEVGKASSSMVNAKRSGRVQVGDVQDRLTSYAIKSEGQRRAGVLRKGNAVWTRLDILERETPLVPLGRQLCHVHAGTCNVQCLA